MEELVSHEMVLLQEEYKELKSILLYNVRKYRSGIDQKSVTFWKFLFRIGTTSKDLRMLKAEGNVRRSSYYRYFRDKLGGPPTNIEFSKLYISAWKVGYLKELYTSISTLAQKLVLTLHKS